MFKKSLTEPPIIFLNNLLWVPSYYWAVSTSFCHTYVTNIYFDSTVKKELYINDERKPYIDTNTNKII